MEAIFAPKNIIKKIEELNKNCIIILGNEPVISNHIKSDIKIYANSNEIGYQSISLDSSIKIDQIKLFFENDSLFSNKTIFNILIPGGRISDDVKKFIFNSISNNSRDLFLIHFQNSTKELLKSVWFIQINKLSFKFEAAEPSIQKIQDAIKTRADFHNLKIDDESLSLLSNLSLGNLLAAENEIIKLSLLNIKRDINLKKLISNISNGSKFDSFKLLNYCMSGKTFETAQVLSYFEEEGVEPLMLNGLFSWVFNAISKIKFSQDNNITNTKLMELRIFGTTQDLVRSALNKLSSNQIEASLIKIKEIDLICKGSKMGDPWLEINRFAFGVSRLFNKKTA